MVLFECGKKETKVTGLSRIGKERKGANNWEPVHFVLISIYMLLELNEQNPMASKKIASIFNCTLNHLLPEGKAVFCDIFAYLQAALCEYRAKYWFY